MSEQTHAQRWLHVKRGAATWLTRLEKGLHVLRGWAHPFNSTDVLFGLAVLVYSAVFFLSHWQGLVPYIYLSSDSGNVASFAAARTHPEYFTRDAVLSDFNNFRGYLVAQFPVLDWLAERTGDYGTAFIVMLGPTVFIQCVGFYVLGRVLYQNRFPAALLAILCAVPISLNNGEYWGLYTDSQPRFIFQALLPWLLALVFLWRNRPRLYPPLMVAAGLLLYVHSVSGPAWGFAIWLGLLAFYPAAWSLRRKVLTALATGFLYLAVIFPFVVLYTTTFGSGKVLDYDLMYGLYQGFYGSYLNLPELMRQSLAPVWNTGLPVLGIGSLLLILVLNRRQRSLAAMILLWFAGLFLVSVALPAAEFTISAMLRRLPSQVDLIRGLRYLTPLLCLSALWGVVALPSGKYRSLMQTGLMVLMTVVTLNYVVHSWSLGTPLYQPGRWAEGCIPRNQILCPHQIYSSEHIDAFNFIINNTPPGSTFLTTFPLLELRYAAMRSLVYDIKDRNVMYYYNHTGLFEQIEKERRLNLILSLSNPRQKTAGLIQFARDNDADYILLRNIDNADRTEFIDSNTRIIYDNGYILVDMGRSHQFEPNRINFWDSTPPVIGYCVPGGAVDLYGLDENYQGYLVARAETDDILSALTRAGQSGEAWQILAKNGYSLWALDDEKLQLRAGTDYFYTFPKQTCLPDTRRAVNPMDSSATVRAYCVRDTGIEIYTADESRKLATVTSAALNDALSRSQPGQTVVINPYLQTLNGELLDMRAGDYRHIFAASRCLFDDSAS